MKRKRKDREVEFIEQQQNTRITRRTRNDEERRGQEQV